MFFFYIISLISFIFIFPFFLIIALIIFLTDFNSPFYLSTRVGKNNKLFKLIKFRSMRVDKGKGKNLVLSTSDIDPRITKIGHFIRRFKIDELPQFINVIRLEMTIVGPRPNVIEEIRMYTDEEKKLLNVMPGITDISSIVFSDEGSILKEYEDPNLAYNQIIRPWKSKLGLFYISNKNIILDFKIIFLTIYAIFNKSKALDVLNKLLESLKADYDILEVSGRRKKLHPTSPPGRKSIVNKDEINRNYRP